MEQPDISVIIATCNHAAVLPMCLQHLENQEYPASRFEVVVADAGSSDGTLDLAARYADGSAIRVAAVEVENSRGLVGALNAAVALARGRLLLMLSPGLLAGPTLLARHMEVYTGHGVARAALGRVQMHPQAELTPFTAWYGRFSSPVEGHDPPGFLDWQAINLSLPRNTFVGAGGFDEAFAFPAFHACELGWRLARSGVEAVHQPAAQTYRWQELSLDEALFLQYTHGYCLHHLVERTHDIAVLHRFTVCRKPLRALADRAFMPLYLRMCRDSAGETRMLGTVLRRTMRHFFLQGYADAQAGRPATPPASVATFPTA
jgi:glycosyltransferase involved in cell wall biosynthesis